jgi:hypothetical protein
LTRLLAALAAVVLGCALQISDGRLNLVALALVLVAGVLAVLAAKRASANDAAAPAVGRDGREGAAPEEDPRRAAGLRLWTQIVLGGGSAVGLVCTLLARPTDYVPEGQLGPIRALALLALLVLSAYLCVHLRPAFLRARFGLLLALAFAMGAAVIQRAPRPWIDVWYFQQLGSEALVAGENPYRIGYPDLYSSGSLPFNDPRLLRDGKFHGFPYPPLALLLAAPARLLFGDVRFLHLIALVVAAAAVARFGRTAEDPVTAELAGLFVALQPRALFVIEQAWTEPAVLALLVLAILAALRWMRAAGEPRAGRWPFELVVCGAALGLAAAIKQYMPLVLLPLFVALPRVGRLRVALVAGLTLVLTFAPFAIWDLREMLHGVIWMNVVQPLRLDALSLVAVLARLVPIGRWMAALGFAAALALLAAFSPRPGRLAAAMLASGAAFLWFLLLNKQAFCNYYFLAVGLLCAACALPTVRAEAAEAGEGREAAEPQVAARAKVLATPGAAR